VAEKDGTQCKREAEKSRIYVSGSRKRGIQKRERRQNGRVCEKGGESSRQENECSSEPGRTVWQ